MNIMNMKSVCVAFFFSFFFAVSANSARAPAKLLNTKASADKTAAAVWRALSV